MDDEKEKIEDNGKSTIQRVTIKVPLIKNKDIIRSIKIEVPLIQKKSIKNQKRNEISIPINRKKNNQKRIQRTRVIVPNLNKPYGNLDDWSFNNIPNLEIDGFKNIKSEILKNEREVLVIQKANKKKDIPISISDENKKRTEQKLYTFNRIKELVRTAGLTKTGKEGILKEPKTEEEFNHLAEIYSPSQIPLKIWCGDPAHSEFKSSGNRVQQGSWCKLCSYNIKSHIKFTISNIVTEIKLLKTKNLSNDEILNFILSNSFIKIFSESIKKKGHIHRRQIERVVQVISLAILKSIDCHTLSENLKNLTKLSDIQVWRIITTYIPILGEIYPEINIDRWLLQPYSPLPREVINQFEEHLNHKINCAKGGKVELPLSTEEIRLESVKDNISKATASRLTHNILGDDYKKYFQSYTQYDRETFIYELEEILLQKYHLATDLVLKLYKLTDLEPNEFVRNFYHKASFLVKVLNEHVNFRRKSTITKIKFFIDEYFTGVRLQGKKEALEIYFDYLNLKEKQLIDKNLPFDFIYLENRIRKINTTSIRDAILDFFESFAKQNLFGIFNIEQYPSASLLKLRGDKKRIISTSYVLDYLKNELKVIRDYNTSPIYHLSTICQKVYASHLTIDHPKILGRILRDYYDAIGAEIPVWKMLAKEYFTGHIDVLLFNGSDIIIGDYKRNIREIKEGLPQMCVYAVLLKAVLLEHSKEFKNFNIKCIGFCEELAIEFNPEILGQKLLSFIKLENETRELNGLNRLQTVATRSLKIRKDLYNELYKVLNS